jgi:sugar lactone lactonase YvrE
VRLTRALWAALALVLVAALVAAWVLTRPVAPEPLHVGAASVLAGDGRDGWLDGRRDTARFSEPFGVAVSADHVVFVSDAGRSHRIRRIDADGVVSTLAGGGRGFVDGVGAAARFATPSALALATDGTLIVADTGNHAIRRVAMDGTVTTVAGDGLPGYVDGPGTSGRDASPRRPTARFNAPVGVAVDAAGRILVADTYNDRIRVIDVDGEVRTLAGGDDGAADAPSSAAYRDGAGPDARFDTPCGVAVDALGRVIVADTGNGLLRAVGPDGYVTTIATPLVGLERPMAVASDQAGDLYVVDERGAVVVLPMQGDPRLIAGGDSGFSDGVASDARFRRPSGLALRVGSALRGRAGALAEAGADRHRQSAPELLIADAGNAMVRLVIPTPVETAARRPAERWSWPWSDVHLPAPVAPRVPPAFDAEAFARTPLLWPVAPLDGPHEVAGTFGEARGEPGQERLHAGLDVREAQGTLVRAVRDGLVSSPIAAGAFGTLNESVRIGPLAYIHIRVGRARSPNGPSSIDLHRFAPVHDATGTLTRMRAKRGAFFSTGDVVGSVNAFNHVHLNVGWSGEEHNPLRFRLVQFRDSIAPTIAASGVRLFDEAWQPLNPDRLGPPRGRGRARRPTRLPPVEPVLVHGRVQIVVDAWDQADGNVAHRRLGLYAAGYQVFDRAGAPATGFEVPRETLHFDRMRRDSEAPRQVYASGSGIPVYGAARTQFLYVVTTRYRDGVATPDVWDTTRMAPGEYMLRVFVSDFSGNTTTRDVRIAVH